MPNNVTDSPKDEHKWDKAEELAEGKLGHKPKSDKDWAYVMGIYKKMKPDHQFKSEKSASKKYDHKEWDSSKKKWIYHYDHSSAANSATDKARDKGTDTITHPANPKLKGGAALHVMHTDAAHHAHRNGDHKKMKHHQDWAGRYGERLEDHEIDQVTDHHKKMQENHAQRDGDHKKYHHHKEMAEYSEASKLSSTVVEKWMARRVVARVQTMKLDRKLKQTVNKDMLRKGLDGNGRFKKPQQGYSRAVEVMQKWNLEIDGTAHSHLFNQPSGQVTVDIAMTNSADRFSPFPINNSMLVVQFHKLEEDRFEVLAYLS